MFFLTLSLLGLILFLACERILLDRRLNSVPLRISVTGTRGKSTVVRMLASVLRENGRTVVAKTTGSKALFILPDGSEQEVPRRGVASIIEQKQLIRLASELDADCLVAEIMSLHPENHVIESRELIRSHVVVVTNMRVDHIDAAGCTEDHMAGIYGLDVPQGARVIIPDSELRGPFKRAAFRSSAEIITIPEGRGGGIDRAGGLNFNENLDLVRAAARHLGVGGEAIEKGIASAGIDRGALRIWKYNGGKGRECFLINGFAANDPQSTLNVVQAIPEVIEGVSGKPIGFLSLRSDRADRTSHWMNELQAGMINHFSKMYAAGSHSAVLSRKVPGLEPLKSGDPVSITGVLTKGIEEGTAVVGMGNFVGLGEELVEYWHSIGIEYGI
jgi:poly-gamma-glutamate synthase PgsB/CapB